MSFSRLLNLYFADTMPKHFPMRFEHNQAIRAGICVEFSLRKNYPIAF